MLVTGAAGFVGGRVAHRVALDEEMELKALVHTPSGPDAMRLARLPAEIEVGSIFDREFLDSILEDCDGVVHCAFGMGERPTSVDGTRTVLEAAESADVESFVHLSTAVVHGHGNEGVIDESLPVRPDTEYAEWKAKGEEVVTEFARRSALEPAVIRPLIVYGPHSEWVTRTISELREGAVLAERGGGTLNQVYVDNLVDAILLALAEPAADGEVFYAADDDDVTWRQFYEDMSEIVGDHPPIETMTTREITLRKRGRLVTDSVVPPARILEQVATSSEVKGTVATELSRTPWAEPMLKGLPGPARETLLSSVGAVETEPSFDGLHANHDSTDGDSGGASHRYALPSERYVKMQTAKGRVSNHKLKALGWEPRVGYDEAMELIGQWAAYEGLV